MDNPGYVFWCSKCKKSHAGDCEADKTAVPSGQAVKAYYQLGYIPTPGNPQYAGIMSWLPLPPAPAPKSTDVSMFVVGTVMWSPDGGNTWHDIGLPGSASHYAEVTAVDHAAGTVTFRVEKT